MDWQGRLATADEVDILRDEGLKSDLHLTSLLGVTPTVSAEHADELQDQNLEGAESKKPSVYPILAPT